MAFEDSSNCRSMSTPNVYNKRSPPSQNSNSEQKAGNEIEEQAFPALLTVLPTVKPGKSSLPDLFSLRQWSNPQVWKAGVVEGASSCCLAYISGILGVTLAGWPAAAVPAGIFFGNTTLVSLLIYATATASGAHLTAVVTISTTLCGLTHPVRAVVYLFCQLLGAAIGGAFLRLGLGEARAVALHNGGCYLDPLGEVSIGQAVAFEFISVFCLVFIAYGIGLDPRQAKFYGPNLAPLFVGLAVGLVTSTTGTLAPGYTGAGMFPGRCFGLAAGIGVFQSSHWVWWVPDILACVAHALLYRYASPYSKDYMVVASPVTAPTSSA